MRAEVLERVPHISEYCFSICLSDHGELGHGELGQVIPDILLPAVVRCLQDTDNQVKHSPLSTNIRLSVRLSIYVYVRLIGRFGRLLRQRSY